MTQRSPPAWHPESDPSGVPSSPDDAPASENLAEPFADDDVDDEAASSLVANKQSHSTGGRRRRSHDYVCPKCRGRFVRMHRRFGDRMLSLINPVRRYGCTNHLCRYETILWKRPSLAQRPIVAAVGLAGAALAGALVMGVGLYLTSDDSTRAQVREVYTGMMHNDASGRADPMLMSPGSKQLPEPKYETASILELNSPSTELKVDFMPPVPTLTPGANAAPEGEQAR